MNLWRFLGEFCRVMFTKVCSRIKTLLFLRFFYVKAEGFKSSNEWRCLHSTHVMLCLLTQYWKDATGSPQMFSLLHVFATRPNFSFILHKRIAYFLISKPCINDGLKSPFFILLISGYVGFYMKRHNNKAFLGLFGVCLNQEHCSSTSNLVFITPETLITESTL